MLESVCAAAPIDVRPAVAEVGELVWESGVPVAAVPPDALPGGEAYLAADGGEVTFELPEAALAVAPVGVVALNGKAVVGLKIVGDIGGPPTPGVCPFLCRVMSVLSAEIHLISSSSPGAHRMKVRLGVMIWKQFSLRFFDPTIPAVMFDATPAAAATMLPLRSGFSAGPAEAPAPGEKTEPASRSPKAPRLLLSNPNGFELGEPIPGEVGIPDDAFLDSYSMASSMAEIGI